jgi:hypothetical protein
MTVGGQEIKIQDVDPLTDTITPALRAVFVVEKSLNRDPNTATVEIFNLKEANRRVLQEGSELAESDLEYDWPLVINAGYVGSLGQIFSGDIVTAFSRLDGVDWITTIEAEDGGKKYRSTRINKSFGANTSVATVLNELASALGVGLGNSAAKFAAGAEQGYLNFENGVALSGKVSKLLDKYVTSAGYTWSIQDGQLQILDPSETLMDTITQLDSTTGLVGTPEQGEKGIVNVTSLLQPTIIPGRRLNIQSKMIEGEYKATKTIHIGDTEGTEWYTEVEGKPLS